MSEILCKSKRSNFTLPVIYLNNNKIEVLDKEFIKKLAQVPDILKNNPVVINISNLTSSVNWEFLRQIIINNRLKVIGITGCNINSELKAEIERSGLPFFTEKKIKLDNLISKISENRLSDIKNKMQIKKTRLIDTPVRSGQKVYASNCDLIVVNHISAGAELIADGNIHVYGTLRGRALAGANGDKKAQIFCIKLLAELVSIAGRYWISDRISAEFYGKTVRLYLLDDKLTIQQLNY